MIQAMSLVFFRQLFFTGVQSAGVILLLAALSGGGLAIVCQSMLKLPAGVIFQVLSLFIIKIMGVSLTLLVISARSISAITTEIATVRVSGEARSLARLGVNPSVYFLLPRLAATSVSSIILYLYFVAIGLITGIVFAHRSLGFEGVIGFYPDLPLYDLISGVARAGFFGLGSVLCVFYFSSRKARTLPDIPLAASNGVFLTLIFMLVMEISYQLLMFALET
jgi:phospholipid/cholesterol/gamma-HCH transport system permease protein